MKHGVLAAVEPANEHITDPAIEPITVPEMETEPSTVEETLPVRNRQKVQLR